MQWIYLAARNDFTIPIIPLTSRFHHNAGSALNCLHIIFSTVNFKSRSSITALKHEVSADVCKGPMGGRISRARFPFHI
ncbi:hypothetical protein M514_19221 [Trichuris suis]|uniref:Uncharacterized protein n=1 Tax=Trichuris suis TaxID=68888 RepID=A0A085NGJ2_9BILA|nr:hypothetical protein M514_19221 [Trichuris suis]